MFAALCGRAPVCQPIRSEKINICNNKHNINNSNKWPTYLKVNLKLILVDNANQMPHRGMVSYKKLLSVTEANDH